MKTPKTKPAKRNWLGLGGVALLFAGRAAAQDNAGASEIPDGFDDLTSADGLESFQVLEDGSIRIDFANGSSIVVSEGRYVIVDGVVWVDSSITASFLPGAALAAEGVGAAGVLAPLAGLAAAASAAGGGGGGGGGGETPPATTNTAPVLSTPATVTLNENVTTVFTASATDAQNQTLTYSISGGADAARFTINPTTGEVSFVSPPDFETPRDADRDNTYIVTVAVTDGTYTVERTTTVTITNLEDGPYAPVWVTPEAVSVAENSVAAFVASATDQDPNSTLRYSISGGADAALFTINATSGQVSFRNAPNFEAPGDSNGDNVYDLVLTVSDGTFTATRSVQLTVTNLDDGPYSPVFVSAPDVSVAENNPVAFSAAATDQDTSTLSYAITGGADAALFTINQTTGEVRFVSPPDFEAPSDSDGNNVFEVQVTVSDGDPATPDTVQTFRVTVSDESPEFNDAPVITSPASFTVAENSVAAGTVTATDSDSATLTYAIAGGVDAARFTINPSTGALSFITPEDFETPADDGANNIYDVQVSVSDGTNTVTQSISVTVTDVNEFNPNFAFRINGPGTGSYFGDAVAVGDLDGDGRPDYVVTAPGINPTEINGTITAPATAGSVYIIWGSTIAADSDGTIDVNSLSSSQVLILNGIDAGDAAGFDVAIVSDLTGDGRPELLIGAPGIGTATGSGSPASTTVPGEAYLVSSSAIAGAQASGTFNLSQIGTAGNQALGIRFDGVAVGDYAGFAVAAGDISGDGLAELVITAIGADNSATLVNRGHAYVLFGTAAVAEMTTGDGVVSLASNVAGSLLRVQGPTNNTQAGFSADIVTDINGDGLPDLVLGVPAVNSGAGGNSGAVHVVYSGTINSSGANLNLGATGIPGVVTFITNGALQTDRLGFTNAISTAGDVNGDGIADLLISAYQGESDGSTTVQDNTGVAYVIYNTVAGTPGTLNLSGLTSTQGIRIIGAPAGDFLGTDVSYLGDIDGDGIGEILVGARAGSDAYLIWGSVLRAEATSGDGVIDVSALNPAQHVLISGVGGQFGWQVNAGGDLNADGITDVLVTAPNTTSGTGLAYLFSGALLVAEQGLDGQINANSVSPAGAAAGVPLFTSASAFTVPENSAVAFTAVASDSDTPTLTYAIAGGADASLFSIDPATGVVSFITPPDYETPNDSGANRVYDVIVSVTDGSSTVTQTVAVTVAGVNDNSPVFTSATAVNVTEGASGTVYTGAATDADGEPLTYSLGGTDAALFSINASSGAVTFLAAPDFESATDAGANNVYDIQVTASDGINSTTQNVAITVTNVNEAPVFSSGSSFTISENGTTVGTATATDGDGTAVTYALAGTDASLFSINASTGALTLAAPANFEAPGDAGANNVYDIQILASDGVLTTTQNVTVTITNVNEAPTFTSAATVSAGENQTTAIDVNASDVDAGTTLTYTITGGADASLFTINSSTGLVTFVNAPNFESPGDSGANNVYDIEVTVSDGTNSTAQSIAITVTNVNETPVITSAATISVSENTTAVQTATATDADAGTALTYSLTGTDAAQFTIDASTGVIAFATAPNFEAPGSGAASNAYSVTLNVSDGTATTTQALTINVTNVNEAPTITSSNAATVNESQTSALTVVGSDTDAGTTLSYTITGGADASLFTLNSTTGELAFIAAPDFENPNDADTNGDYVVEVTVSDGALTAVQTITITVADVAEGGAAPVFLSGTTASVPENTAGVVYDANAVDGQSDPITYSLQSGGDNALFTIDSSTGEVSFITPPDFDSPQDAGANNVYNITVIATAGPDATAHNVAITVTNVNEAPTFTSATSATVNENQTGAIDVNATDQDAGTTLTYAFAGGADDALFSIDSSTGVVTFNAAPNFEAPGSAAMSNVYSISVSVSDGFNPAVVQNITITVANVNDAPVITSALAVNVAENTTAVQTVTSTDADGGTPQYSISGTDAALFTIDSSTGVLTFNAAPNFEAPGSAASSNVYSLNVNVFDGTATTTEALTVTVTNENDNTPSFTSSNAVSVSENSTAVLTVTATDADAGATLSYSISGGADQALFNINSSTGALTFVSGRNFEAPTDAGANNVYDIQVQVSDGVNSATQNIAVTVTDVIDQISPTFTYRINGTTTGTYFGDAVAVGDLDGDSLVDYVIAAPGINPTEIGGTITAPTTAGSVFIVWGTTVASDTDGTINLTSLSGSQMLVLNGVDVGDAAGFDVAIVSDLTGDGRPELLIGAPGIGTATGTGTPATTTTPGEAYLVSSGAIAGAIATGTFDLSQIGTAGNQSLGIRFDGVAAGDYAGFSVASADVNGDGLAEVLVTAIGADNSGTLLNRGHAYLLFGTAAVAEMTTGDGVVALSGNVAGTLLRIQGPTNNGQSGFSVSFVDDISGDSRPDLVFGAPTLNGGAGSNSGVMTIVYSATINSAGANLNLGSTGTPGIITHVINGAVQGDSLGFMNAVSTAGDVNGDGVADLLISAYQGETDGSATTQDNDGAAYILYSTRVGTGGTTNLNDPAHLTSATGIRIIGAGAGSLLGTDVSYLGDIDGDGIGEILIGAHGGSDAYLIWGSALRAESQAGGDGIIDLSTLNPTQHVYINGPSNRFGVQIEAAGDLNGDGVTDLLITAPNVTSGTGRAFVISGQLLVNELTLDGSLDVTSFIEGWTAEAPDDKDVPVMEVSAGDEFGNRPDTKVPVMDASSGDELGVFTAAKLAPVMDAPLSDEFGNASAIKAPVMEFWTLPLTSEFGGPTQLGTISASPLAEDGPAYTRAPVAVDWQSVQDAAWSIDGLLLAASTPISMPEARDMVTVRELSGLTPVKDGWE